MAVNNLDFGSQVSKWCRQSDARMLAVAKESTKRVTSLAQSRIPVDTGFARASIRGSLSEMPQITSAQPAAGQAYGDTTQAVVALIATMTIGARFYIGWTANYVPYLEYGSSSQAPQGFVRVSALEWPRIVSEVCHELQTRVEG